MAIVTDEPIRIGIVGLDYVALGIFTEDELPKYKVTVEDGMRLAKEYSPIPRKENRFISHTRAFFTLSYITSHFFTRSNI